MPGEGKSFIAANLAIAFATSGSKVLLVDCDIRKGRQHYIFGTHNHKGLSNLLLEDVEKKIGLSVLSTVPIYRPSKKKKANNINIKRGV